MGRSAQFSDKQILQASMELEKEGGQQVTAFAIRNHIGGGSHARIEKIWRHYSDTRNEGAETLGSNDRAALPAEAQVMLGSVIEQVEKQFCEVLIQSYQAH